MDFLADFNNKDPQADTKVILLDAKMNANLNWDKELKQASEYVQEGKKLLWQLDLGLFQDLQLPIKDKSQIASLRLAVKHFYSTVWEHFDKNSVGVILYKGGVDFSKTISLEESLFPDFLIYCETLSIDFNNAKSFAELTKTEEGQDLLTHYVVDLGSNYLNLLTDMLPDGVPLILPLENNCSSLGQALHLLSQERWERYQLCFVERGLLQARDSDKNLSQALLIPEASFVDTKALREFYLLAEKLHGHSLRFIPDPYLIYEWHALDTVYVASACARRETIRRLQGFCAAGGNVVTLGDPMGLASEETL